MKQPSAHLFFLLAVFVLLQSCCKKDNEPAVTTDDLAALKSYAYFLPGTYWIYQDNHGNIDSMYVVSANSGYDSTHDGEYFISKWHSSYDTYDYLVEWNTSWSKYKPTQHIIFMTKLKIGDYVGQIILLEYPFNKNNKVYWNNNNTITTSEVFDSYMVNANNFMNVAQINESRDITNEYFQATNYYIGKNIGIVQEELLDSNIVWKLINYNIIQ